MSKTKIKAEQTSLLEEIKQPEPVIPGEIPIEEMPLNCLADYLKYNKRARALNKSLGIRRHRIKQCPVEMHPKQRVMFNRKDQPANPLPVFVSNEMIEFEQTLIPGQVYDLPLCIIDYLAQKGTPLWDWFDNPDGSRETRKTGIDPRFALRTIYQG